MDSFSLKSFVFQKFKKIKKKGEISETRPAYSKSQIMIYTALLVKKSGTLNHFCKMVSQF